MARRQYSDAVKAEAMAALLAGQSVSHVASEMGIPRGTVANWSSKLSSAGVRAVSTEKKEEIGDMLAALVEKMIAAQSAMLDHFRDAEWLRQQDAAELGVLFGVTSDKLHRMLEAFSRDAADD